MDNQQKKVLNSLGNSIVGYAAKGQFEQAKAAALSYAKKFAGYSACHAENKCDELTNALQELLEPIKDKMSEIQLDAELLAFPKDGCNIENFTMGYDRCRGVEMICHNFAEESCEQYCHLVGENPFY